ncbi:MAG TPA: type II toxin-antitoxin system HicA family toxin [Gemmataceae bacterium]|jgi:predicted RNA binding protein YcfA (HicA-like mRNA interferase family)
MAKFPKDAPKQRVVKALERLGFRLIREHEHISMARDNADGTRTPLTMPNHRRIKGSTLRAICTQANIPRNDFLRAYREA